MRTKAGPAFLRPSRPTKRRRLDYDEFRRQTPPRPQRLELKEEEGAGQPRLDLISRLPDDILGEVITLLPAAEGARTQLLSRRWRPLWRSAPLNLEAETFTAAAAILSGHRGGPPCRRFSLTCPSSEEGDTRLIDKVLRLPGLDGLPELELYYTPICRWDRPQLPALPLLFFSPTLRVLSLCCRHAQMTLKGVFISESILHGLLSGCPVLRSLVLMDNAGRRHLRLRSPTLRILGVSDGYGDHGGNPEEVVVEDAPLLERLITDGLMCGLLVRVVHAPKLKIVGYIGDGTDEYVHNSRAWVFKKMELVSLPIAMRSVKILALDVSPDNLDAVIDFLTWFPCVEKLHVVLSHWKLKSERAKSAAHHVSLECLDEHLKMLELQSYRGSVSELSFIRFFLSNARVLESMKFLLSPGGKWGPKSITRERKKLRLSTRASPGARFCFEPEPDHRPSSIVPIKHIHDFALDDPFNVVMCRPTR
ncbi:unnamed protein product [Urochloa decumbens]|uniref:FBD domain-containing protein n=1 Tax=Urochloa decumbens TaxID=240449 RepID=A0ABC9C393_9POAL